MSDMSRPSMLPTAPEHVRHDPLLIAQFAAGDELDPEQARLAQFLTTTCGACADLAADLRAVSSAIAWEPVPPRRRDLRITEIQAERSRGGFASRVMRRLAMPRAGDLRPAAAGVMSLGLLFIVAGAVWPFDGTQQESVVPASAPSQERVRAGATAPAAVFDDAPDGVAAPDARAEARPDIDVDAFASDVSQKAARTRDVEPEAMGQRATEMAEDASELAQDADLLTENADALADDARELAQDADALADDASALARDANELGGDASRLDDGDAGEAAAGALPEVGLAPGATAPPNEPSPARSGVALEVGALASPPIAGSDDVVGPAVEGSERASLATASPGTGIDVETILVALGVVMAAGGALLLVLVWLARRSTDQLLR